MEKLNWNYQLIDVFTSLEKDNNIFYLDDVTSGGWSYIVILENPLKGNPWEIMDINESKKIIKSDIPFSGGLVGWLPYSINSSENWDNPKKHPWDHDFHLFEAKYILCFHKSYGWWTTEVNRFKDIKVLKKKKNTPIGYLESTINFEQYSKELNLIKNKIFNGEMYEANFTFKLFGKIKNPLDLYLKFRNFCQTDLCSYLKYEDFVIGSGSPELFLSCENDIFFSEPMKGTTTKKATSLIENPKERSELSIIVDLVRNDFYKCCYFESVSVSDSSLVKEYPTIKQAVAKIYGKKKKSLKKWEMIKSLFPSGSVTGAPRSTVIRHLDEREKHARGVYCGAMGWWSYGGNYKLSLPIRTFVSSGEDLEYCVGSGVTWRSNPQHEWLECKEKAKCIEKSLSEGIFW